MVKRVYNLYPQVHTYENLIRAERTSEIGRLLGGWRKAAERPSGNE